MDAFFASVEEMDNPSIKGLPIIVGGHQTKRGVVSSASYPARAFGVKAAMPLWQAKELCPQAVFLPVRMHRYAEVSQKFHTLLYDYTPLVEPMGFDEAYLDVTGTEHLFGSALEIAQRIQRRVKEELGLSCSLGISYNKFLAKIASGWKKPGGIFQILEENALEFLDELPLEELPGVGYQTKERLERMGLKKVRDLKVVPPEVLEAEFGKLAEDLLAYAKGRDDRPVIPSWDRKSMGEECTLERDLSDQVELLKILLQMSDSLGRSLRQEGLRAGRITIKIRYPDFKTITRSRTFPRPVEANDEIYEMAKELFLETSPKRVRLVGISLSRLLKEKELPLFSDLKEKKEETFFHTLDKIQSKYGEEAIKRALGFKAKGKK